MANFKSEKIGGVEVISRNVRKTIFPHIYVIYELVQIHGAEYLNKSVVIDMSLKRVG